MRPVRRRLGLDLLAVQWGQMLDGLELQQDFTVDDQIGAEAFAQRDALVLDRNRYLALNAQPALCQLVREGKLVDLLQQPWTQCAMYRQRAIDDSS